MMAKVLVTGEYMNVYEFFKKNDLKLWNLSLGAF